MVTLAEILHPIQSSLDAKNEHDPVRLLRSIYFLPMDTRKAILQACRIQRPICNNRTLSNLFDDLPTSYSIPHTAFNHPTYDGRRTSIFHPYPRRLLQAHVDLWVSTPHGASYLSYFVRAEKFEVSLELVCSNEV